MNHESGIKPNIIDSRSIGEVWKEEIVIDEEEKSRKWFFVIKEKVPQKMDFRVELKGRGAKAEIVVAYFGKNKDNTEMNITLVHDASQTFGRVTAKAALFDESRFILKGMLDITANGKGSDSYLLAKGLLMSPKARAEIYPYLEIKTDEIKASHGSSVGRIDEKQLFYLQSRGIVRQAAEKIILSGFFGDFASYLGPEENNLLYERLQK